MYIDDFPNHAQASPGAILMNSYLAIDAVPKGYAQDPAQTSTRDSAIGYLPTLEGLLQVPRLQLGCEVRAIAHTTHGGIR